MWTAKIQKVIENNDGTQGLEIVGIFESENLRNVYEFAMNECRTYKCALAAIYKDMKFEDVVKDDAAKKRTHCEYQICRGELGGILLWGRNNKKMCEIRENK